MRGYGLAVLGLTAASCQFGIEVIDRDPTEFPSTTESSEGGAGSTTDAVSSDHETPMSIGGDQMTADTSGEGGGADVVVDLGLGGDPASGGSSSDYCLRIPALLEPPVLDGVVEAGLILEDMVPLGWSNLESGLPPGNSAQYAVAWRADSLYFFVAVKDPDRNPSTGTEQLWMGDGIELHVDADGVYPADFPYYDDPGSRHMQTRAPANDVQDVSDGLLRFPSDPEVWAEWSGDWIVRPTSEGYVLEALVRADILNLSSWDLSVGDTIGFDISHNVSVPPGELGVEGNRLGQYFLSIVKEPAGDRLDYPYANSAAFCTATLL